MPGMMSTRRIYLDACCFIELVLDASGGKLAAGGKYVWYLRTLLRAAREKQVVVVTSLFTAAECLHADGKVDDKVQHLFRGFLTSGTSGVTPWQMDIFAIERARELRWKHDINLKPADAIHVATAIEARCDEFLTWDGLNPTKRQTILKAGPTLAKLGLNVCVPSDTQSIPDAYRQQQLAVAPAAQGTAPRQ
jgi:hypothetical protein